MAPMFQHRHYVAIANVLANLDVSSEADSALTLHQRFTVAETFANMLRGTNPNFDYDRFMAAALGKPSNRRDA